MNNHILCICNVSPGEVIKTGIHRTYRITFTTPTKIGIHKWGDCVYFFLKDLFETLKCPVFEELIKNLFLSIFL